MIALDTNLLLYAHREGMPEHVSSRKALEGLVDGMESWGIPAPVLLEFWSVVTHPMLPGGASTGEEATLFLRNFIQGGAGLVWDADAGFGWRVLEWAGRLNIRGPRIFDLQIGLMALEHGVTTIWSHDKGFVVVPGLRLVDPLS